VEAAAALSFGKCGPGQSTPPTVLTTPDTGYSATQATTNITALVLALTLKLAMPIGGGLIRFGNE